MSNNKVAFRVGDRVSFGGLLGTVDEILHNFSSPVKITYDNKEIDQAFGVIRCFTRDGRIHKEQTEPVLKLISRPKRKVTKTVERWVNVYEGDYTEIFSTEEMAKNILNRCVTLNLIACVKLTGTYEIEVDDVD